MLPRRTTPAIMAWLICLSTPLPAQHALAGEWLGEFTLGGRSAFARLRGGAGPGATLDMPLERPRRVVVQQLTVDSPVVSFRLPKDGEPLLFEGRLAGGRLTGQVARAGLHGRFEFVRLAPVDLALYQRYAGSYRIGDGFLDIAPFSEDEDRLRFFDSRTRRTGVLYGLSETEFFSGPSTGVGFPMEIRVGFQRDAEGRVTGLTWRDAESTVTGARVRDAAVEDITVQNGNVTLRGSLTMPAAPGPHPVLVLIPGSGPARRPGGFWIPFFVRQGIAVLVLDKRGAGASSGDWKASTYDDLAADALAAVEALKHHPRIDPKQIGLWGNSEGGWVAPLAASRSADVAFLIVRSGSALPVWQTVLHEAEGQLRDGHGLTEEEIRAAVALKGAVERIALEVPSWDDPWRAIDSAYEQARPERWFGYVAVDQKASWFWQWWRLRGGYDPTAALERIRCPVLVLLGEVDQAIPSKESAVAFERAFRRSGLRDYTIRILPKASHGLLEGETGLASESPRLTRFASGYMDGMATWLLRRVRTAPIGR